MTKLLYRGAEVNSIDAEQNTALTCAIENGDLEIFRFLIKNGANVNGISRLRVSELTIAVFEHRVEFVKILLEHGANPNLGVPPNHPLFGAIKITDWKKCQEITLMLLNYGADINVQENEESVNPLMLAASRGSERTVAMLLDRGARRDIGELYEAFYGNHIGVVRVLVDRGYDANCVIGGDTALSCAIELGNSLEIIKLLLDKGARVNDESSNNLGKFALLSAAEMKNKEVVKLLLEKGADVNVEKYGETALTISIRQKCNESSEFLVRRMILMVAQGLDVSEVNLNAAKSSKKLNAYLKKCADEIKQLKSIKFDDSDLSYFDIFGIQVCKLAGLARNESIVKVLKSVNFKKKFSIYGVMIVEHFEKGMLRNKDYQLFKRFINYLSTRDHHQLPKLPMTAISEIFTCLDFEDVAKLRKL